MEALKQTAIMRELAAFDPHVVGTPPLGLDLPTSDVDVICFAPDATDFACAVWKAFGARQDFGMWQKVGLDRPIVANFAAAGWIIEIFGQSSPIFEQFGWRHFIVEQRLLALGGDALRSAVMTRRISGMKTEPSFAVALGLSGDPYEALLDLGRYSDLELAALIRDRGLE